ncbi:MAG: glycosyltransferase family 2 protein [Candidatus Spechtbacteria bacterium]|nr:glycosyltransferase family 2 protein [Candidatus Spechtbacteria bacterium]
MLTIEEAAGEEASRIAGKLKEEYSGKFPNFFITTHPSGLPGEIPGKGSNERWAGLWIKENFIDRKKIPYEHTIVSTLDADTVVYPHYFSCLAYHYLTCQKPLRSSFQPIPLFINNIWQAPALSRVIAFSSTFWHTMNQERPEKHLTFSSHAMPFHALADIGFWEPNVVSEDSRIFWQCFLHYNGDYRVISLYYPVRMDANVARSFWRTLLNIYRQQRRWAYGAADIAYFLSGFLKNKKIPKSLMWQYGFSTFEGFYSWATHAILIFILGWLPLILGDQNFHTTVISYNLPRLTRTLLAIAMVGILSSASMTILLLPSRPKTFGRWRYIFMVLQWFLVPATLIIFGSFPAIEAQIRLMLGKYLGFWPTEKFRR